VIVTYREMNLFLLSLEHRENAEFHCDQHVVKMILESAQLLCGALHISAAIGPCYGPLNKAQLSTLREHARERCDKFGWYMPTHVNHPLAVWARASLANYRFVKEYAHALHEEFQIRFGKKHKSGLLTESLGDPNIPDTGLSEHVTCMPDQYKVPGDPVASYRAYYMGEKLEFARYKRSKEPWWFRV